MPDPIDDLIRQAKPTAPSHHGVLAAVAARGSADVQGVGAASWILRAAAVCLLAAGVGALTALLSGKGVGSPAAGDSQDLAAGLAELHGTLDKLEQGTVPGLNYSGLRHELQQLSSGIDALEQQLIEQHVLRELAQQRAVERRRWQDRHVSHVTRRYQRAMDQRLDELAERGLTEAQLEQATRILAAHGEEAVLLVRRSYASGQRVTGAEFALLAREAEDRLSRVTGDNGWSDVLGAGPEHWAPTDNFRDWDDVDSLVDWTRRTSRG